MPESAPEKPVDESSSKPAPSPARAAAAEKAPAPPRVDSLPPFRVLLHNDDVNTMDFVVDSLIELTPLVRQNAHEVMLEAHATGVALVLVTHKERAELYQEQFRTRRLTVTIEPVR
ncbi:MAG: ATP-dependent Clp protease adaptor ClpS [Phycisphaeraceae bacterium]|nr:ATP-dependent Clp protease adaptor ClpS [Phycisphaeraceae bacterium]